MATLQAPENSEGIRLSKRVADMLKCSRAEAEQVIVGGWVKVNQVVVDEPAHRVKDENIDIHSTAQRGKVPLLTVILHKTAGQSCLPQSHNNVWKSLAPEMRSNQDRSGISLTPRLQKMLQCAAALEDAATGLVVLSEDPAMLRGQRHVHGKEGRESRTATGLIGHDVQDVDAAAGFQRRMGAREGSHRGHAIGVGRGGDRRHPGRRRSRLCVERTGRPHHGTADRQQGNKAAQHRKLRRPSEGG